MPEHATGLGRAKGEYPVESVRERAAAVRVPQGRRGVPEREQTGAHHRCALGGVDKRVDHARPQAVGDVEGAGVGHHPSIAFPREAPRGAPHGRIRRMVVALHEQPRTRIVQVRRRIGHVAELAEMRPGAVSVRLNPTHHVSAQGAIDPGERRIQAQPLADVPLPPNAREREPVAEDEAIAGVAWVPEQVGGPRAIELREREPPAAVGHVHQERGRGPRRRGHQREVSRERHAPIRLPLGEL